MSATAFTPNSRKWRGPKWGLALPSFIWYGLFFVAPIAIIVIYSFGAKDTTKLVPVDLGNLSLENYRESITGDNFNVFWSTLKIAVTATLLCVLIGFPVSYYIAFRASEKWRAILLGLVVIPSFTSFLIRTIAWRIPLSANGELSKWLQDMGWIDAPLDILGTRTAVFLAIVYNYIGFMVLPMFVALDRIDPALREASKDLGGTRLSTFVSVTLPLSGPGVVAGVLLTFIPMCGDYITATVLGGAKGFMVGALIDSQFRGAQNWPEGSAMAVVMILMVLLSLAVFAVIGWLLRRLVPVLAPIVDAWRRRDRGTARPSRFPDLLRPILAVWTVLVLVFLFIPILLVVRHSFNNGPSFSIWSGSYSTVWWGGEPGQTKSGMKMEGLFDFENSGPMLLNFVIIVGIGLLVPIVWKLVRGEANRHVKQWSVLVAFAIAVIVNGLTTNWYLDIFQQAGVGEGLRGSFLAAFGGTLIAVTTGGLCGIALARHPGKWSAVMMALLFLILVTPEIMDAIALSGWMQRLGGPFTHDVGPVPFGMLRLWIGQSLYASAVVTLIVRARLSGIDASLEEAAADLGAPPGRAFRQVTLPLIAPALIAGGLLSFTLCLDNTIISSLISGASSTFPVALISATKSEIKPFWGVGAVVLFVMTMALLAFVARVLKKSGDSSSQIAATLAGG
uniref:Spermidine Putrescine ABC transporter permease component PotB n=1 Tax=uncultured bacterium A1Q1_fos_1025 TaxID=1256537 RepID=L7VRL5_9BACT|nr:spermidine Putrescine ABC transporter permease component PotB [uncultured bacterium A1Q1_fos_1025]